MICKLFDTHCHLTFEDLYPRRRQVIADAAAAGVTRMITVACVPNEWETALAMQSEFPIVWVAASVHPHEACKVGAGDVDELARIWGRPSVVAAGEMGLDYHYDFSPRQVQQSVFERQLELAWDTGLPLVIHCREAHDDVVRLLEKHGYRGKPVVFHCFGGGPDEAADLRSRGWWVSFSGILTFKKARQAQAACAETPIDQILFETDAPYLSPEPVRNKRPNEPAHIAHTVRFAAQLRGEAFDTLAAASTANAVKLFAPAEHGDHKP
ncbi:MAG: TatD family hydrolase [Phycisphaerae bacterium]